jgi:AGCS family alanine or glycine:cation symporter
VGTGNLAGVAVAIYLGGAGAIFWMWVVALIGMATGFAESTLAQLYKIRDDDGNFRGGPAYYMEKGLGKRWMGVLFSIFLLMTFGLAFNGVQSSSIAAAMDKAFSIDPHLCGIVLSALAGVIMFGGLKRIAKFAEITVPLMALCYLLVAFYVILMNLPELPGALVFIVQSAFGLQEAGAGAIGYSIAQAAINGFKRGMFSNEAGMGSAPNAAASATPTPHHPASQGYVQMMGVFFDTLVLCTATACIIILSGAHEPGSGLTGVNLLQEALSTELGGWASIFIAFSILLFAFTSVVANYSYAETNLIYLEHNHVAGLIFLRIAVMFMVYFGAVADLPLIWSMADLSMAFMAVINLIALLCLSGVVIKVAHHYNAQLERGQEPFFHRGDVEGLDQKLEPSVWTETRPASKE